MEWEKKKGEEKQEKTKILWKNTLPACFRVLSYTYALELITRQKKASRGESTAINKSEAELKKNLLDKVDLDWEKSCSWICPMKQNIHPFAHCLCCLVAQNFQCFLKTLPKEGGQNVPLCAKKPKDN